MIPTTTTLRKCRMTYDLTSIIITIKQPYKDPKATKKPS